MYAASSTSGSGRGASSGLGAPLGDRRVRAVRLLRPRRTAPFGFSIRGGREYATGFFISKVEFNSEAHRQGLKVGDQLISVNGYRVDDAVHSELVHYFATQSRLKFKVRHVGMLPIKEKPHEPLSWQYVSDRTSIGSEASSSPTLCHDTERMTDMRLSLLVPPRAKLGCGICKGPDWKPGIFVQFVREGGIAREAGLRPGDQILSCNGCDFSNITFNEAIAAMKVCGRLELMIREGAGVELVSPESSGYNSSASSAAGERSPAPSVPHPPLAPLLAPPATLRRRLASVAEEAADRADRLTLNRLKRRTWDSLDFGWKNDITHSFDLPSDIEPDYDSPSIPNNPHTYENKTNHRHKNNKIKELITSPSNRTIINLTEDGATIQCSYANQMTQKTTSSVSQMGRDEDKKTIVVEVHHTSNASLLKPQIHPPPLKQDCSDTSSVTSSLSSAIAEEIQRRKMVRQNIMQNKNNKPVENSAPTNILKLSNVPKVDNEKKKQHDALMDEFKKVHRKMFANQELITKTVDDTNSKDNNTDNLDRQQTLPLRKVEDVLIDNNLNNKINVQPKKEVRNGPPPPPPPPMPITNGHTTEEPKVESHEPISKTLNVDHLNKTYVTNHLTNGTLKRTPTPDYNGKTNFTTLIKNGKDEKVELESLESYKLKNPLSVQPSPPSNYFVKAPNGTATMKKHITRPVSVTIGEYGSFGAGRKEPCKLDFLNGDKLDGPQTVDDVPITNRLQSELAFTLSRSNLRKKTEALDNAVVKRCYFKDVVTIEESHRSMDENFHARYGVNLLPLPPSADAGR